MDFSTQVPVVRCARVPVVMSYRARHEILSFLEDDLGYENDL
jgi:hypothetical protein